MEQKKQESVLSGALVTGNFTIQAQMPMGKTITVSGYLYEGESIESVNGRVNIFHDIVDFQRTRAEIPELEAKLDQRVVQLGQMRDALTELEAKKLNGKLSSQEKQMLGNMETSIVKVMEDIAKGEEAVAAAKAKVNR